MIVEPYLQRFDDLPEHGGRGDVVTAGSRRSGWMVVRQHDAPGIEVEGTAHRATQRDQALGPPATCIEVLGDVDAFSVQIEDQHALLAPTTEPID